MTTAPLLINATYALACTSVRTAFERHVFECNEIGTVLGVASGGGKKPDWWQ